MQCWRRLAPALWAGVLLAVLGAASAWGAVTPSFYTTASPNTTVGLGIFDHANLMSSATGTITFRLYAPGDSACQTPIFTSTVPVSGTGSDNSGSYNTPAAGTYQWVASYSGDANDNPISSPCGSASQSVIVGKVGPVASMSTAYNGAGAIQGTATLRGGFAPLGGTITFTVTGPNDTWCAGAAVYTHTVAVNGAGSYGSGWFSPTAAGTYTYRIRYSGDADNYGVGPTNCIDQSAAIALTQAQIAGPGVNPPPPPPPPPPPVGGPGPTTKPSTGTGPTGGSSGGSTTPARGSTPAGGTGPAASAAPAGGSTSPSAPGAAVSGGLVFAGPASCVRGSFRVFVAGSGVRQVSFYLSGRRMRTVTRANAHGQFAATIKPKHVKSGAARHLVAKVSAARGTLLLRRSFTVCG